MHYDEGSHSQQFTLVRAAGDDHAAIVARLYQLYRHDLSQFRDSLPEPDGLFRTHDAASYVDGSDADRATWLVMQGDRPVGFAMLHGLTAAGPRHVYGYWLVRRLRGTGIARAAALQLIGECDDLAENGAPAWEIAFQEANAGAAAFWRRSVLAAHRPRGLWQRLARGAAARARQAAHRPRRVDSGSNGPQ